MEYILRLYSNRYRSGRNIYQDALTIPEFTVDTTQPNVTVNQKAGQTDPATTDSASFTITFDEAIDATTFEASDINNYRKRNSVDWTNPNLTKCV